MRWKIIVVNTVIILTVALLSYVLVATSLSKVVANPTKQKQQVDQALRAANAQLALDALRLERWLDERVSTEAVRGVFSRGTIEARRESATAHANKLRDAAVAEPQFAKMAPALVLFVEQNGVSLGRNASELMRGEKITAAYPSLATALKSGATMSDVWLNRSRQEQMLASYAPVRGDDGAIVGAVVVGTPLSNDRLVRTSQLTSGHVLLLGVVEDAKVSLIADSGGASPGLIEAASNPSVQKSARGAHSTGTVIMSDQVAADHFYGAAPLVGYGDGRRAVLIAAVPASLVSSPIAILWPVFGVAGVGVLLVALAGFLMGNYISRPISDLEDGLLAIINGKTDLRFQIEHADLGGLVFRINSLLNALMGVPEDTTDDQGRPSTAPSGGNFQDALAVDESSVASQAVDPRVAAALAAEPADRYYQRLYAEYLQAKRQIGDPVDHITQQAFYDHIRTSEQQLSQKHGAPMRYQVQVRGNAVVLNAVPLPS